MMATARRKPDNQPVNASGYVFGDSTVKLLERYSVIQRGS